MEGLGYEADVLPTHPTATSHDSGAEVYPLLRMLQVGIGGNDPPEIGLGYYEIGAGVGVGSEGALPF